MQPVSCPGCGAPVQFKSAASVMVVCPFCKTTLLKDADSIRNLGKMSEVLEDYSPLQIGTSGQVGQRAFSLIGRIQLQYADGYWNEWYLLFDDGSNGWLSDASGQYTLTAVKPTDAALPLFEKLIPGHVLNVSGQIYATSDVRTAQCTAGQGELPFKVGQGWVAKVADFRAADRFLSLDYSDPGPPKLYVGQSVQLADLKAQLLRDPDQIKDAAGRFHGKLTALTCPSCGAPISSVAGITVHIVCPNCHAEVDTAGTVAKVLAAGAAMEAVRFTLALGSEAMISGNRYTIIGAMRRSESDDGSSWSEYLLYSPRQKFIWLIETDEGWQRAEVLDRWPGWDGAGHANLEGQRFDQRAAYTARVVFAAGSFNWRVSVGDLTQVNEFSGGMERLAAESTREELTWSRSRPVPLDQVRAWFGGDVHADVVPHPAFTDTARKMLIGLALINAIPLVFVTSSVLPYALLAAASIYLPAYYLDRLDAKGQ